MGTADGFRKNCRQVAEVIDLVITWDPRILGCFPMIVYDHVTIVVDG